MATRAADEQPAREVVVGRHSRVWRACLSNSRVALRFPVAIGHDEVSGFAFAATDRVWVFSYSRRPRDNSQLVSLLETARVREVVYVSTAATIVTRHTRCYQYPRVKQLAEDEARLRLDARILTLGMVYEAVEELPAGTNAATPQRRLEEFLLAPRWLADDGKRVLLFDLVSRPFRSAFEGWLFRAYGIVQSSVRAWPCVLRPVDLVLRACGFRWYGYVHLSNRLWISAATQS